MKIVVIDDDPTGSQAVYNCPLLLRWDVDDLISGLVHPSPLLFLLADTRALTPDEAARRNRSIVMALDVALTSVGLDRRDIFLVSRGDSTLRGHGFLEPSVLANSFGPFDATFHCPAFLEGGRTTLDGIHLLHGQPVHMTSFAKDPLFGFSTSYLPAWLEEKSNHLISIHSVEHIKASELDSACNGGLSVLVNRLRLFKDNVSVVVDAVRPDQLSCFVLAVRALCREKRFLFRSAASLLKALADLDQPPPSPSNLASLRLRDESNKPLPGLVMVGSYVPLADQQLVHLLSHPHCVGLEIPVHRVSQILDSASSEALMKHIEYNLLVELRSLLSSGHTPVLYSGRGQLHFDSETKSRLFSVQLSQLMARLASSVAAGLGYLISKGGTTTQALLSYGLSLSSVHLEGQLLPGLSIVRPTDGSLSGLPIVTFPGNLGDRATLLEAWQLMDAS